MRGFVLVNYGKSFTGHLRQSIKSIKEYCDYPITLYTNESLGLSGVSEVLYKGDTHHIKKYFGRGNVTERRTMILADPPYDETCYLDGDIYIIHQGFRQAFDMLSVYPILMPQNPRWFVTSFEKKGDSDIGAYINKKDKKKLKHLPKYLTAWNGGVQFVKKGKESKIFYDKLRELQLEGSGRDQTKMALASWKTGVYPYVLPPNWCVCQEHVDIEYPLALHCGHEPVMKLWREKHE